MDLLTKPDPTASAAVTVTWIAVSLVVVVVIACLVGFPFLLKFGREERKETLDTFRLEMAAERAANTAQVAITHDRIDRLRLAAEAAQAESRQLAAAAQRATDAAFAAMRNGNAVRNGARATDVPGG